MHKIFWDMIFERDHKIDELTKEIERLKEQSTENEQKYIGIDGGHLKRFLTKAIKAENPDFENIKIEDITISEWINWVDFTYTYKKKDKNEQ